MPRAKTAPVAAASEDFLDDQLPSVPPAVLKVKRLVSHAVLPTFASKGAACFDIYSVQDVMLEPHLNNLGRGRIVQTGIAVEIPPGFVLKIYSRSGMGFVNGVRLGNCTGVIDSDYRGELKVKLQNDGPALYRVRPGDRIAQGMLEYVYPTEIEEVADLSPTERGEGGLGSTGR